MSGVRRADIADKVGCTKAWLQYAHQYSYLRRWQAHEVLKSAVDKKQHFSHSEIVDAQNTLVRDTQLLAEILKLSLENR